MTVVLGADIITLWEGKFFDSIFFAASPRAWPAEEAVHDLNEN
jgi:hypothetical protein